MRDYRKWRAELATLPATEQVGEERCRAAIHVGRQCDTDYVMACNLPRGHDGDHGHVITRHIAKVTLP